MTTYYFVYGIKWSSRRKQWQGSVKVYGGIMFQYFDQFRDAKNWRNRQMIKYGIKD